jgi:iron(III) transport system permease protein
MKANVAVAPFSQSPTLDRLRHQIGRMLRDPAYWVSFGLLLLIGFLVLLPTWKLVIRTLTWGEGDRRISPDAVPGEWTLFHWEEAFISPISESMLYEPLMNSMVTGGTAALLALILGAVLAWLVTRTDMPGSNWLRPLLTLPYVAPSFALALAWTALFKSTSFGGKAGMFEAATGVAPPDWLALGPVPIIATMTIHYFPFAFLMLCGALSTMNAEMEESATLLGASRSQILRRITLPLVLPALIGAFILIFAKTIGSFALPYLLGVPEDYHTIGTRLLSTFKQGLEAMAFILSLVLIVITGIVLWMSSMLSGKNQKRFQTVGGKGNRTTKTALGVWRLPVCFSAWLFTLAVAVFPLVLIAYQSFLVDSGQFGWDNLTLHYWFGQSNPTIANGEPGVVFNPSILSAASTTLQLAAYASVTVALVGLVIGYIVVRQRGNPMVWALEQASFLPFLIPGLALAAMYMTIFIAPIGPIPALYGTFALLVLICAVDRLPFGVRNGMSSVTQLGNELEEAAQLQGASWWKRFSRIVMPLASNGMLAAAMVSFVGLMRELTLIILLITPSNQVLMTLGLRYADQGFAQLSSALIMIVVIITLAAEALIWTAGHRAQRRNSQPTNTAQH